MSARLVLIGLVAATLLAAVLVGSCSKNSVSGDEVVDDGIAPTAVSDLRVIGFSDTSVTLSWTATGDDSTTGTAASYDLRVWSSAIHYANFDSAHRVTGLPTPRPAGQTEEYVVTGLDTDSTYYFALRVFDENDNYDNVSNCVSATCYTDFVISIPDPGLLAAIRNQISKPTGDIYKSDLMHLFDLLAESRNITNLSGLEYFTNLVILNIIDNAIDDLTPIANLDSLAQLHAGDNLISDLSPLAGLARLQVVSLNSNQVDDVSPLAALVRLTSLNLQSNHVTDIAPILNLVELQYLDLSNNNIHDITPLIGNAGLGAGDVVVLIQNPLEHESVMSHIPALRGRGVTVQWIDNTVPPGSITDLSVDTVTAASVTLSWTAPGEDYQEGTAYRYEMRYATDQSVVSGWSGGESVPGMPAPDTAGTRQSVTVDGLSEDSIFYFALRVQDNSENWSTVSNVVLAQPYTDVAVTFPDAALESAIRDAIGKPAGDIYKSDLLSIDTLIAGNRGIVDLSGLDDCINIKLLHLIDNDITDLAPLSALGALYDLNLQGNNIADISPLVSLTGLGALQLTGNPLANLDALSGLTGIWFLAATFTGASDLQPLASLTNLEYLFVSGNGITDLSPLAACSKLRFLYADYNSIQSVSPLGGLSQLMTVSLKTNAIEDISAFVSNPGMGAGDHLALESNPLSAESINTFIPALQARGVTVTF
jgi:Leucine-rich repeat (LRR) protein